MTDLNELLKHTSRSLYLSARLLPIKIKSTFCIAYLLCRYADSIADTTLLPIDKRLSWIKKFPQMIIHPNTQEQQQLTQDISGSSSNIYEKQLLYNLPACLEVFHQLPPNRRQEILEVVHAVCEGMKIDLTVFPAENSGWINSFSSEEDLEYYCHLMGGAPGIFWSKLILADSPIKLSKNIFLQLGQDIGDAEQIVNILRDLPRDLRIGRCYFPNEELKEQKLSSQNLLQKESSPCFEPIKQKWIAWGRKKLRSAFAFYAAIPRTRFKHRAAVAWPALWAADTLNKLSAEKNLLDNSKRVKISRIRIYMTMLVTLPILISNTLFTKWLEYKLSSKRTYKK